MSGGADAHTDTCTATPKPPPSTTRRAKSHERQPEQQSIATRADDKTNTTVIDTAAQQQVKVTGVRSRSQGPELTGWRTTGGKNGEL
jgi:hypothetical protein